MKMIAEAQIHLFTGETEKSVSDTSSILLTIKEYLSQYKESHVLRPTLLVMTLMFASMWTGAYVLVFYGVKLIQDMNMFMGNEKSHFVYLPSIFLNLLRLIGSIIGTVLLHRGNSYKLYNGFN